MTAIIRTDAINANPNEKGSLWAAFFVRIVLWNGKLPESN